MKIFTEHKFMVHWFVIYFSASPKSLSAYYINKVLYWHLCCLLISVHDRIFWHNKKFLLHLDESRLKRISKYIFCLMDSLHLIMVFTFIKKQRIWIRLILYSTDLFVKQNKTYLLVINDCSLILKNIHLSYHIHNSHEYSLSLSKNNNEKNDKEATGPSNTFNKINFNDSHLVLL